MRLKQSLATAVFNMINVLLPPKQRVAILNEFCFTMYTSVSLVTFIVYTQSTNIWLSYNFGSLFHHGVNKIDLKVQCWDSETFILKRKGSINALINHDEFYHLQ